MSKNQVLVLRACRADMSSRNSFVWPESGYVECHDWLPTADCGNGLHGWLHGHGTERACLYWDDNCKWLVVKVNVKDIIDLEGKVKFKCGEVVFCGDRINAVEYLLANDPIAYTQPVIGAVITKTDLNSFAIVGDHGIATTDRGGTSISGRYGTSISGDFGDSDSGYCGISKAGFGGMAKTGLYGKASSGECGTIVIKYWEGDFRQLKIGYINKDGLEPDVLYKLDSDNNFVKAE